MDNVSKLVDLAKAKFGNLEEPEEKLFRAVTNGEPADYSAEAKEDNDPSGADRWRAERVLMSDRIAWLCTDKRASNLVTHRGIQIKGAHFKGKLDLSFAKISFPLIFEKSAVPMEINLQHAEIFGLNITGTHTGQLNAYGLRVAHDLYLRNGFKTEAEVHLSGAIIGGILNCDMGQFINADGIALRADRMKVEGGVYLRNDFTAKGEVCLRGATIGEALHCDRGQFINAGGVVLRADRLKVEGAVFLCNHFKAEGTVSLPGATIGGTLNCDKGRFINADGVALNADRLKVEGDVFLRNGFKAEGEVRLRGATIGGALQCDKGQFINAEGVALRADRLKVGGAVFLRNHLKVEGKVSLVGSTIGQYFVWTGVDSPEKAVLDLRSASIGTLEDEEKSWPEKLSLHGLVYEDIKDSVPRDTKIRIKWLHRQYDDQAEKDKKQFHSQPYEQLAKVLRKSGLEGDAKDILIYKNKDKARYTKLTWSELFWYYLFGPIIGYGYRPWRAFWLSLSVIVIGSLLFGIGYLNGLVTPQTESAYVKRDTKMIVDPGDNTRYISDVYPKFNFFVYSVDLFVPLVNLHQSRYMLPNANRGKELELFKIIGFPVHTGGLLRLYMWIHITLGWILTSLLVVGLTGLVRT